MFDDALAWILSLALLAGMAFRLAARAGSCVTRKDSGVFQNFPQLVGIALEPLAIW